MEEFTFILNLSDIIMRLIALVILMQLALFAKSPKRGVYELAYFKRVFNNGSIKTTIENLCVYANDESDATVVWMKAYAPLEKNEPLSLVEIAALRNSKAYELGPHWKNGEESQSFNSYWYKSQVYSSLSQIVRHQPIWIRR